MDPKYPYEIGEVLLRATGISKAYGDNQVLKGLNVEIPDVIRPDMEQGQVVAILGPSGCGKTTLFKILAGLIEPDEGDVLVGVDVERESSDSEQEDEIEHILTPVVPGSVGVVYQSYPLFDHRRVRGNMLLGAQGNPDLEPKDYEPRMMELLERFGVAGQLNHFPGQLSGGQRQRVAIAQQLICGSTIILMDEPFSGLDALAKRRVCELLVETTNMGEHRTVVVISHDIPSALRVADTVWLMGRDFDGDKPIPGARIVEQINLMDSIAWRPDNHLMPEFTELVHQIEARYERL